jgi:predicted PurR-regulated permease PerM
VSEPTPPAGGPPSPSATPPPSSVTSTGPHAQPGAEGAPPARILPPWLRRFGRVWGFALFLLVLVIAFRSVILPFILGMLVAYILAPVVRRLSSLVVGRAQLPRWISVLIVYVGLAATIAIFFTAFLPALSGDFARLFRESPRFFRTVKKSYVPAADAWLEQNFPQEPSGSLEDEPRPERKLTVKQKGPHDFDISLEGLELELEPAGRGRWVVSPRSDADEKRPRLADLLGRAAQATEAEMKDLLLVGQRFVASVLKAFAWFVLTFMVAAYILVDVERVMGFLRSLVPPPNRPAFDDLAHEIDRGLSGVIRGQLMICVVNGLLTTVGLLIFHVKYGLLLGLLAGMFSFIPVFGSILSSVPIVTVALASGEHGVNLGVGLGVLLWIIGIHFLEANLLNPKIIGTAAKIHPVVVVFALMVGEETGGLIGALLAVPIASMVQATFVFFRRRARVEVAT